MESHEIKLQASAQIVKRAQEALEAGDAANAFEMYIGALSVDVDLADAWMGLAKIAMVPDQFGCEAAIAMCRRVVALIPNHVRAWTNLGNTLRRAQQFAEAEKALQRAIEIAPADYSAHYNLGALYFATGRAEEAEKAFANCMTMTPASIELRGDHAMAVLKTGDLARGLDLLECRWEGLLDKSKFPTWECGLDQWRGQFTRGGTLLLHHEQGIGDTIQFARFIPAIKAHAGAARIIFAAPKSLMRLLDGQCGIDEVIDDQQVGGIVSASRRADYHCPLGSAVAVLRPEYSFPMWKGILASPYILCGGEGGVIVQPTPYLKVPAFAAERKERFRAGDAKLAIGLCWGASPTPERGRQKSVPLRELLALGAIPGTRLWSLQFGPHEEEMKTSGGQFLVSTVNGGLGDFADTAAFMSKLDLVISIDTSTAHLAGALGLRTFMLNPINPCWRWVHGAAPWYGSMTIFDQADAGSLMPDDPNSWKWPIALIRDEIRHMLARKSEAVAA